MNLEFRRQITGKPSTFAPSAHTHDASALINALGTGTASPADGDYIITQWAGTGTEEEKQRWIRRPASAFWAYIKGKTDALYQTKGSYAAASHTHDDRYYTESEIDEKLSGLPTSGHTHAWGDITGKPSTFAPSTHKHVKADITDFPTLGTAAAKNVGDFAAASHSHAWGDVTGKPSVYPPEGHTHKSVIDNGNSSSATTFAYSKSGMDYKDYTWLAGWNNYELRAVNKSQFATAGHTHNYAGSSSAGGTAASVNGFTFGVQTSDPGANSSLTTNKFLFVYE